MDFGDSTGMGGWRDRSGRWTRTESVEGEIPGSPDGSLSGPDGTPVTPGKKVYVTFRLKK